MHAVQIIALTMGVAWASGINLYAAVAALGILGATGHIELPPGLLVLQEPVVIAAAGFMYCVEFFADKAPGIDTAWDAMHGFIRIPAAAVLAAAAVWHVDPAVALAAALVGGTLGAASYGVKAGGRVLVNASPEPFSNVGVSLVEDVVVLAGLWTALYHPAAFLVLLAVFAVGAAWALPRLWRGVRALLARLERLLTTRGRAAARARTGDKPVPGASGRPDIRLAPLGRIDLEPPGADR